MGAARATSNDAGGLPLASARRALSTRAIATSEGVSVDAVAVDGLAVSVTVPRAVDYAFPGNFGLPTSMTATGSAVAQPGIVTAGG